MVNPNHVKFEQTLGDYFMMPNMLLFQDIQIDIHIIWHIIILRKYIWIF
jgi:hypothetical protein